MNNPIRVSASILCADFTKLGDEIKKCEDSGADIIHVDVMDGHFVPNISIGGVIVEAIRPITKLPIDTHLMITNPSAYIEDFIEKGADIISIHAECYGSLKEGCREEGEFPKVIECVDIDLLHKDIVKIKDKGKKVFIVVNPETPLCFESVEKEIDGVLIMSVNPGFARQKFMDSVLEKVKILRSRFSGDIAIDGGVNAQTSPAAVSAGVNVLAAASYLFGAKDFKKAVSFLKTLGSDESVANL